MTTGRKRFKFIPFPFQFPEGFNKIHFWFHWNYKQKKKKVALTTDARTTLK